MAHLGARRESSTREHSDRYKQHATSHLNGLRGLASLIVFLYHLTQYNFFYLLFPYSYPRLDDGYQTRGVLQLPFIRIIHSGPAMVPLFFVVSGFVIAIKPLTLVRSGNHGNLVSNLASFIFRRGVRIYLPVFATIFLSVFVAWIGLKDIKKISKYEFTLMGADAMVFYANIFNTNQFLPYKLDLMEGHLWTIPVEMICSFMQIIALLGFSRVSPTTRLVLLSLCIAFSMQLAQWAVGAFLLGGLLSEFSLIQSEPDSRHQLLPIAETAPMVSFRDLETIEGGAMPNMQNVEEEKLDQLDLGGSKDDKGSMEQFNFWTFVAVLNLVSALVILSWPTVDSHHVSFWVWFYEHTPQNYHLYMKERLITYFWYTIASGQLVVACQFLAPMRAFFNTRPLQYLGKISFALYLTHWTVLMSLAGRLRPYVESMYAFTGTRVGDQGGVLEWLTMALCLGACAITLAHWFHRLVDVNAIKAARLLDNYLSTV